MSSSQTRPRADRRQPGGEVTVTGPPTRQTSPDAPPGEQISESSLCDMSYGGFSVAFVIKQNLCTHRKIPINFKSPISRELNYSYKYSAYFFIACSSPPPSFCSGSNVASMTTCLRRVIVLIPADRAGRSHDSEIPVELSHWPLFKA